MIKINLYLVLNVIMTRLKRKILACRVSFLFSFIYNIFICIICLNFIFQLIARTHKFGRQGQTGAEDDYEGGDYGGNGYYSGTSNDYSSGGEF